MLIVHTVEVIDMKYIIYSAVTIKLQEKLKMFLHGKNWNFSYDNVGQVTGAMLNNSGNFLNTYSKGLHAYPID